MSEAPSAQTHAPTVYALPEHAHVELIQLRDHLRLMAQLTECGSNASRHDAWLRPDALAWWFSRLSRDIGAVVDATYFSNAVADEAAHAATKKAIKARKKLKCSPRVLLSQSSAGDGSGVFSFDRRGRAQAGVPDGSS